VDRDDPALRKVDVDLVRFVVLPVVLGAVEDDEQAVAVVVDLRALRELLAVLDGQGRQAQDPAELRELVVARRVEVESEELAGRVEPADLLRVEVVEDVHPAPRP
jgi:hypothetical protein